MLLRLGRWGAGRRPGAGAAPAAGGRRAGGWSCPRAAPVAHRAPLVPTTRTQTEPADQLAHRSDTINVFSVSAPTGLLTGLVHLFCEARRPVLHVLQHSPAALHESEHRIDPDGPDAESHHNIGV